MDDEEETTEENSSGNKQNIKPEVKSDINSVIKLDIHSDNNFEIMHQEQQVKVTSLNPSIKTKSSSNEIDGNHQEIEMGDTSLKKQVSSMEKSESKIKEMKMEKCESKLRQGDKINFPRSTCKPRSRDPRRCQKHFREMIGLHEMKNEELERKEGDLRQRLEMLECSMPAVMVWNIWRMAQGAPVPNMRQVVEKQFQGFGSGCAPCPSTPSQHYDCRVRQIEAERKRAQRRADEARALCSEKEFALGERKRKLEEAKKIQTLHKERIEKLKMDVQELNKLKQQEKEAEETSCETGKFS